MNYKDLTNTYNEFTSLANELLNSNEDSFTANLSGFKNFCDSNQTIVNILKPIPETNFNGIEYFCKKLNTEYRFEQFAQPKTRYEILKVSYDVLWDPDLKSSHIWNYASLVMNPDTNKITELLHIGNKEISGKLINYIDLELEKLINSAKGNNNSSQVNFNIQSAPGSIIGTQTNATINNGASFDEIIKFIKNKDIDSSDKQQLLKLTNYVKTLAENNAPMSKGLLSKFSDIISKHSWVPSLIGSALIKYFIK